MSTAFARANIDPMCCLCFWTPEAGTTYHALAKPQTVRNFKARDFYISIGARTPFLCGCSGYRMGSPRPQPPRTKIKKKPETCATPGVDTEQWASPLMPICVNACPRAPRPPACLVARSLVRPPARSPARRPACALHRAPPCCAPRVVAPAVALRAGRHVVHRRQRMHKTR